MSCRWRKAGGTQKGQAVKAKNMRDTESRVDAIPPCDECRKPAEYDAKTKAGPWAYLCGSCFDTFTHGKLGLGVGQRLVLRGSDE